MSAQARETRSRSKDRPTLSERRGRTCPRVHYPRWVQHRHRAAGIRSLQHLRRRAVWWTHVSQKAGNCAGIVHPCPRTTATKKLSSCHHNRVRLRVELRTRQSHQHRGFPQCWFLLVGVYPGYHPASVETRADPGLGLAEAAAGEDRYLVRMGPGVH